MGGKEKCKKAKRKETLRQRKKEADERKSKVDTVFFSFTCVRKEVSFHFLCRKKEA